MRYSFPSPASSSLLLVEKTTIDKSDNSVDSKTVDGVLSSSFIRPPPDSARRLLQRPKFHGIQSHRQLQCVSLLTTLTLLDVQSDRENNLAKAIKGEHRPRGYSEREGSRKEVTDSCASHLASSRVRP